MLSTALLVNDKIEENLHKKGAYKTVGRLDSTHGFVKYGESSNEIDTGVCDNRHTDASFWRTDVPSTDRRDSRDVLKAGRMSN